jgi:hypothetical protein
MGVSPLVVTARWLDATVCSGRRGSGTSRQSYRLTRSGSTAHVEARSDGSARAIPSALPPAAGGLKGGSDVTPPDLFV